MEERRLIHEPRRVEGRRTVSRSDMSWSLGVRAWAMAANCRAASSLVILLAMRRWERSSWLGLVARDAREMGAVGMGRLKCGAVAVIVEVCTAVGIELAGGLRAGAAFFLLGWELSKGVSRPNDRPTAEAPTTVAVAQSCITRARQSWRLVQLVTSEVYGCETGAKVAPLAASRRSRGVNTCQNKQGRQHKTQCAWRDGTDEKGQGIYRWNSFHSRCEPGRRGKVTRRGGCDDKSSIMACQCARGTTGREQHEGGEVSEWRGSIRRLVHGKVVEQSEGRAALAPRRAEAARWSSRGSGREAEEIQCLLLLGSTYRATQFTWGLARCRR